MVKIGSTKYLITPTKKFSSFYLIPAIKSFSCCKEKYIHDHSILRKDLVTITKFCYHPLALSSYSLSIVASPLTLELPDDKDVRVNLEVENIFKNALCACSEEEARKLSGDEYQKLRYRCFRRSCAFRV